MGRVGTGSGSGNTTTPTPTPTAAPTPAVASVLTQTVTFSSFNAAQYTGGVKTSCEQGYGTSLTIYANSAWVSGASVSSSASRRAASVAFTATVPATHITAA